LPGSAVFEVGFGVGFYMNFWRTVGCGHVTGVEISPTAVANVKARHPNFDLRLLDIGELHNETDWLALQGSFQLVTLIDVLYHIMDDAEASQALRNVAQLVASGGVLVLTEKFPATALPISESRIVRRRPLDWYEQVLGEQGLTRSDLVPVFWCMDPPIFNSGQLPKALTGYLLWAAMRASLKYWPKKGSVQDRIGQVVGKIGAGIDRIMVSSMHTSPNLTMAVFRRG